MMESSLPRGRKMPFVPRTWLSVNPFMVRSALLCRASCSCYWYKWANQVTILFKSMLAAKIHIRRAIEAEGIPYTFACSNYFAGYSIPTLAQSDSFAPPPKDKLTIFGDGNVKAIFVNEDDIGTYTIKAVDDPRTLNKILHVRPESNIYTHNELITLYEQKSGKTFERIYLTEEEVLKKIKEASCSCYWYKWANQGYISTLLLVACS
ncbi:isoflavone reductase-like protein isoform X2 [Asparagus officinalis]|uniref:isoflavone reductase-like protein isoform X2 n=1 Tax=Asparagus officinalis TaxID=4686 RepID=UPI00098E04E1|nr:isoflavone reductase-like protein isoform X2 [Asparagus officinalis]